jgi:DNA polymerase elongation subunit (family B)
MGAFDNICQLAGVRYHKALHNSDLVDVSFLRKARKEGVRLPTAGETDRDYFWGAYVFPPQAGLHGPVGYLDLASLYPNLIIMLNASPDTVIGDEEAFAVSQYDESEVVWAPIDYRPVKRVPRDSETPWQTYTDPDQYKMIVEETGHDEWTKRWEDPDGPQTDRLYFIAPHVKEGFITDAVRDWIAEKYEYEGGMYAAIKQIVNSTYGYLGFTNSRLFDWRLAEAITLAGREVIKYTAWEAQSYIHDTYETDTSVKMGDTDGCGIVLEDVTDTDWAREVYEDTAAHVNDAYDSFCRETFGVRDHTMDVELESVAARVFVPASSPSDPDSEGVKKRYGQHIVWDEGEAVDEITVTGLEATRSDTAPITERLQMDVMETLLRAGSVTDECQEQIRDAYTAAVSGEIPLDELAPRKGLSSPPAAYGSDTALQTMWHAVRSTRTTTLMAFTLVQATNPLLCTPSGWGRCLPVTRLRRTKTDVQWMSSH